MPTNPGRKRGLEGYWLTVAIKSFVLMLAVLYLEQGLPSLLYVVLILGFLLLAMVALVAHHFYSLLAFGRSLR